MVWLRGEAYLDVADPKIVHIEGAHIDGNFGHSLAIIHRLDSF